MFPLLIHGGRSTANNVPTDPPTTGKDISAPILVGKGLSFTGITDAINTSQYDTSNPFQLFAPNVGGRNQQDNGIADRHSIGVFHGYKCLRTSFRAGQIGYLRYNSLYLPGGGYDRIGLRANVYIPSDTDEFELLNSSGGKIDGKSVFGLNCGRPDCYNPSPTDTSVLPAAQWRQGGNDQVNWPDDQFGCALGVNTMYRENNTFEFTTYLHAIGGRQNGTGSNYRVRQDRFSILYGIGGWTTPTAYWDDGKGKPLPRGQWFLLELFAKMDTNALNGEWELWVNGVKWAWAYGLDLGGWQGDRRTLTGSNFAQQGSGIGDLWTPNGGHGGGWKFRAIFCRDMLGGAYDAAHTPRKTAYYYARDWAVYTDGAPVQPTPPQAVLTADPGSWSLVFEDTFENGFDYNNWAKAGEAHPVTGVNWGDLYPNGTYMTDWLPSNVYVSGNQLHLRVTGAGTTWHGGMIHQFNMNGRGWKYGYFEVKFKTPSATQNGFTAPFWMLPQYPRQYWSGGGIEGVDASGVPWPDSGEIDVTEQFMVNLPDEGEIAYSTLVYKKNGVLTYSHPGDYRVIGTPLENDWHTLAIHWFEDPSNSDKITIRYMHNGTEYSRITQDTWGGQYSATAPFDQPFYFLMGIHGGTGWGGDAGNGAGFPPDSWNGKEIIIDYVRVFQRA